MSGPCARNKERQGAKLGIRKDFLQEQEVKPDLE